MSESIYKGIQVIFSPLHFELDFPVDTSSIGLQQSYTDNPWKALYMLGFEPHLPGESPTFLWLHNLADSFVQDLSNQPALEISREQTIVPLSEDRLFRLLDTLPFGIGIEAVTSDWLQNAYTRLTSLFCEEIALYPDTVALYFSEKLQDLRIPERIFFHLVESRQEDYPFAFLATYSTRDAEGKVRHQPLSHALLEYKNSREKLVALLSCLNRAADAVPIISEFMASGELFHPLRLTSSEAYTILKSIPAIEGAGIRCRLPNWWRRKTNRITLSLQMGNKKQSLLGLESMVSMVPSLTVDGVRLTQSDIRKLLSHSEGLALIKGKWVEVDHEKLMELQRLMEKYNDDLSMMDILRMQGGIQKIALPDDVEVTNGKWLSAIIENLRHPREMQSLSVPSSVNATLRPYQKSGFYWLSEMASFGFGACLADDMGLGKTLQVLTFLSSLEEKKPEAKALLIVPASLIGNWKREIDRFTPGMPVCTLHGQTSTALAKLLSGSNAFLTITTYGVARRMEALKEKHWDCLILDEAQAIKNPSAGQTKSIKKIPASFRIAMTGTPIENNLSNLWSLFDFLNRGLLGSFGEFHDYTSTLDESQLGYAKLKRMISPFILRRLKTDKSIISDLPDKIEMTDYVDLAKEQVALYRKEVADLKHNLETMEGIQRKGLVLASISRFKQICNHPDQYLGLDTYAPKESGKFQMLSDLCETIRDKHERVLVFTQYREITPHLDELLRSVFGRPGLIIHGQITAKKRTQLVEQFNGDEYVPYMILTIKAGGTGLNLTRANHVILFDRWWNPAVESQAIDRAFRIGQRKDVMVHKFVARSTIEEKIADLLSEKEMLSRNIVGSSSNETWITEMSNEDLLNLVRLEV